MRIRPIIATIMAVVFLGTTVSPLGATGRDDCEAHQHEADGHAGHDEGAPPDGALGVLADTPAHDCPHCPDTTCAAAMACSGGTASSSGLRSSTVDVPERTESVVVVGRMSSAPPGSPPTPPPVAA